MRGGQGEVSAVCSSKFLQLEFAADDELVFEALSRAGPLGR